MSSVKPVDQAIEAAPDAAPGRGAETPDLGVALRAEKPIGWFSRWKIEVVRWFLLAWVRAFSLRGLYLFGKLFGFLEFLINFKRRARYRRELRRLFPEGLSRSRENVIIRSYVERTRCDKLFYLIFDRLPRRKILRRIRFQGREIIDDALQRGKGVFAVLSHNGSHHVAGLLMALLGYRCAGVRDRNESVARVYMQQRYAQTFPEFAAIRVLYADTFPRDIYRCFRENCVVGAALDVSRVRGLSLKTCPVQLLGETREFLTGTMQIALRSHATIIQGFVVSRPNFYYRLVVRPLHIPATGAAAGEEIVPALMQQYADGIAAHLREHPDHLSRI